MDTVSSNDCFGAYVLARLLCGSCFEFWAWKSLTSTIDLLDPDQEIRSIPRILAVLLRSPGSVWLTWCCQNLFLLCSSVSCHVTVPNKFKFTFQNQSRRQAFYCAFYLLIYCPAASAFFKSLCHRCFVIIITLGQSWFEDQQCTWTLVNFTFFKLSYILKYLIRARYHCPYH